MAEQKSPAPLKSKKELYAEMAEKIRKAYNTGVTPPSTKQVGPRSYTTRGETADDKVRNAGSLTNTLFGSGDANIDVALEVAAEPSPRYNAIKENRLIKEKNRLIKEEKQLEKELADLTARADALNDSAPSVTPSSEQKPTSTDSFTASADKRIASAVQPIEEALAPIKIQNKKEFDSDGSLQMEDPAMSNRDSEQAEQAPDQALVEQLFKTTHGTSFDPKSSRDKQKRAEIEEMLGEMGGGLGKTTPNQFALQLYRKYKYL